MSSRLAGACHHTRQAVINYPPSALPHSAYGPFRHAESAKRSHVLPPASLNRGRIGSCCTFGSMPPNFPERLSRHDWQAKCGQSYWPETRNRRMSSRPHGGRPAVDEVQLVPFECSLSSHPHKPERGYNDVIRIRIERKSKPRPADPAPADTTTPSGRKLPW